MIDLAPNHKLGLIAPNPILLAGGVIGYGEALHTGLDTSRLGGVVVGPITLNSRGGADGARLAELNGGFVLETGLQNRGLNAVLKQFAGLWPRLGCPVIAQLADAHPSALSKVAARLTSAEGLSGLELLLPRTIDAEMVRSLLRVATSESDLPVWVKLPLENAAALAPVAVEAGAVGLVVGQPLMATVLRERPVISASVNRTPVATVPPITDQLITGSLYGPLTFAPILTVLLAVARLALPCALIACGGIHTLAQVRQALAAGAQAVQIDSAVWVEPGLPGRLAEQVR